MVIDRDGTIYLALREGNALYRIAPKTAHASSPGGYRRTGMRGRWRPGAPGEAAGPKGLALAGRKLYVADTESHTIRRVNLDTGVITTVLGTGVRGDGPETRSAAVQAVAPARPVRRRPTARCTWPTAKRTAFACCGSDGRCGGDSACRRVCFPNRATARGCSRPVRSLSQLLCGRALCSGGQRLTVEFERRQAEGKDTQDDRRPTTSLTQPAPSFASPART